MDDAIALLKDDHKKVMALLKRFDEMKDPEPATKRKLAEQIIRELMIHETIEEQVFYPAYKKAADDEGKELVAEAKEEHHVVDVLIEELQSLDIEAEDFDAKMTVLKENVEHHIKEEEEDMFPDARKLLAKEKLVELRQVMAELKQSLVRELPTKRQMEH